MIKVLTIVGTRPEIIRLSSILKHLNKYFKHYLIHTGQNYDYELNQKLLPIQYFEIMEILKRHLK